MCNKKEITICLGSSCFARGNKTCVQTIKAFIEKHNLDDKVFLRGSHCFGKCIDGPVLKINNTFYENVNHSSVTDILTKELL